MLSSYSFLFPAIFSSSLCLPHLLFVSNHFSISFLSHLNLLLYYHLICISFSSRNVIFISYFVSRYFFHLLFVSHRFSISFASTFRLQSFFHLIFISSLSPIIFISHLHLFFVF